MKYDLIVVGGGPGGLMAAKTAAEDGLKVILVERKRNITEIHRTCSQVFYVRKFSGNKAGLHGDGYIESVSVEVDFETSRFNFPGPGFSLDYNGPLKPHLNWIEMSPSGYRIYSRKNTIWGFVLDKEAFLAELLASVQKAGVEVWPETIGISAENTPDGVKVLVRGKRGEQTLEARAAIAADGISSNIVDSLGLNKKRQVLGPPMQFVGWEMEGVETDLPPSTWLGITMPSLTRLPAIKTIMMGEMAGDTVTWFAALGEDIQKFMKHPNFAHWFRHARVVRKNAVSTGAKYGTLNVLNELVVGNVVVVGDAAAIAETWIQGAVAMAYMAVKAIEKELGGQTGYPEYIDWWHKAFYHHKPDYLNYVLECLALANAWSGDEEVDYIYNILQDKEGMPPRLIYENLELLKPGRPELYQKLKNAFEEVSKMVSQLGKNPIA
jgi:flavin-dependent dehydrogenase